MYRRLLAATSLALHACDPAGGVAVNARTDSHAIVRWATKEVTLRLSTGGATALSAEGTDALRVAVSRWNTALSHCDAPRLKIVAVPMRTQGRLRSNGINDVVFHSHSWCPWDDAELESCYDGSLNASTRLRHTTNPEYPAFGVLAEADIEINGVDFRWSSRGEKPGTLSLEAMFMHELGHVLGLDHPCSDSPSGANTQTTISCADERVVRSVMHPQAGKLLVNRDVVPLSAEVNAICRAHGEPG